MSEFLLAILLGFLAGTLARLVVQRRRRARQSQEPTRHSVFLNNLKPFTEDQRERRHWWSLED